MCRLGIDMRTLWEPDPLQILFRSIERCVIYPGLPSAKGIRS